MNDIVQGITSGTSYFQRHKTIKMSVEKIIKKIRAFVRDCKIFIGKSPSNMSAASSFFPFLLSESIAVCRIDDPVAGQNSKREFTADEEFLNNLAEC